MIPEAVDAYAAAIRDYVGPDTDVAVYLEAPDTAAGPAVWVDLDGVRYVSGTYRVALRARCIAGDGREPTSRALELRTLADRVIAAAQSAGTPQELDVRPGTHRAGDHAYPTVDVVTTFPGLRCDLPAPIT